MKWVKPTLAEFLGTFFLCFAGIAAILGGADLVGVALAHGLALSVAVNAFGGISGAHINPAVSISMYLTDRLDAPSLGRYIAAQLAGATVAAFACRVIFPAAVVTKAKLGIPLPGSEETTAFVVVFTEIILTFLLVTAIFGTAVDERGKAVKIGGFGIGLTVTFNILACGPITGASMNPARSFGPALALWHWDLHWAYWLAPLVGGVAAALLYHHVLLAPDEEPSSPSESAGDKGHV